MVIRIPANSSRIRGSVSIQFIVILTPVLLGMMGFAVDLGRLYLVRGELNQAASAMALAAATKLNGTVAATDSATAAARATLDNTGFTGNKYNFGSIVVGDSTPLLSGNVPDPAYFATLAEAQTAWGQPSASGADGTTARHVTVNIAADAPLLFWSLLSLGQSRKTSIAASAVAGVSAPLCTACSIEPFAVPALNASDSQDFGFVAGTLYTLGYQCTGAPAPAVIAGTTAPRIQYVIIDRFNAGSTFAEDQQLFRNGAQGLVPSTTQAQACSTIGSVETIWASAPARACSAAAPSASIENALCGLTSRMTDATPAACQAITDIGNISTAYSQDTDVTSVTDYTTYQGNNRRLLTLPVVDALATLNVVGFRQFLLEPNDASGTVNNPADADGRFVAMYLGVVAPVKQGRMDGACGISSGPGKVVLHQ